MKSLTEYISESVRFTVDPDDRVPKDEFRSLWDTFERTLKFNFGRPEYDSSVIVDTTAISHTSKLVQDLYGCNVRIDCDDDTVLNFCLCQDENATTDDDETTAYMTKVVVGNADYQLKYYKVYNIVKKFDNLESFAEQLASIINEANEMYNDGDDRNVEECFEYLCKTKYKNILQLSKGEHVRRFEFL